MKNKIINKIKAIIEEIGSTSTGETLANYSQLYKGFSSKHFMLVEGYNLDSISVVEYINEIVVNEFEAPYTDLKNNQLKEILFELKEYAQTV